MLFKKKPKDAPAETPAEADGGEAAPAKKKPPIVLIAAAGAVVLLGGGGTGAFFMLKPKPPAEGDAAAAAKKKPAKRPAKADGKADPNAPQMRDGPDGIVYYTLPDVVVNMQTAEGRPSFLKLKLTFELPDYEVADALEPNMPRLQDMFQGFMRELRPEDLAGSQGGYQLRMEIMRRVNLVVAPSKVNAVLIEEMLIN